MVRAWYMDSLEFDQRAAHITDPPQFVELKDLAILGVRYYNIDADNYESDETLRKLREENHYDFEDLCDIQPGKLPDYENKLKIFFEEHLHTDDEIRLIVDGSGYFDIRDKDNKWIRIEVVKGDMIILPAGIYHRFTLDLHNFVKAKRYFTGVPVWTPHNRAPDNETSEVRLKYIKDHYED